MLIIDAGGDEAKVLKTIYSGAAKSVRKDVEDAIKRLKK